MRVGLADSVDSVHNLHNSGNVHRDIHDEPVPAVLVEVESKASDSPTDNEGVDSALLAIETIIS